MLLAYKQDLVYVYINVNTGGEKHKVIPSVSCLSVLGHPGDATLVSPGAPPEPWPPAQGSGCRYTWVEGVQGTSRVLQVHMGPPEETWDRWTHADHPWTDWVKLLWKSSTQEATEMKKLDCHVGFWQGTEFTYINTTLPLQILEIKRSLIPEKSVRGPYNTTLYVFSQPIAS